MKKLVLLYLSYGILLFSCENKHQDTFCNNIPLETPTLNQGLDYTIINSIVNSYYSKASCIVIDQETDSTWNLAVEDIKEILAENNISYDLQVLSDYSNKNETCYYLSNTYFNAPIKLISHSEINCYASFKENGWNRYYQNYPDSFGFITFSRPGVNINEDMAIIEYYCYMSSQSAISYLVILEKINENWVVTNRIEMWTS